MLEEKFAMQKVFISFHHANDQGYKDLLIGLNEQYGIFDDVSVNTHNIADDLPTQTIRQIIRDDYLRDSTVTIVLVGTDTRRRKHVDWEIKSSMIDGSVNKKSGILVINLPSTGATSYHVAHDNHGEKVKLYPEISNWRTIDERTEYERLYPHMPDRIIDNLLAQTARISVVNWDKIDGYPENLRFLIEATAADSGLAKYDLARPMRMANSSPA
tara:strand:- start:1365 stop:2006 length:642 start_codon:yes stop_codon:yes gene_type:complete